MKFQRLIPLLGALCLLVVLPSCGGSGGGGAVATVQAQSPTYSMANFDGTYNLELAGVSGSGAPASGFGSIVANGSGQITSGSYSITANAITTCSGALSGSYSVGSNGSGTATIAATPDSTSVNNGCPNATLSFTLAVSASGNTVAFSESDTTEIGLGMAVK